MTCSDAVGFGPALWAVTVNVTFVPTAGVGSLTDLVKPTSAAAATMLSGASTELLGKNVHESSPLASPNAPVHGTLVLPPAAVPKARWLVAVLKPLMGSDDAVAGGLLPQRTLPTVFPMSTTVPLSVM